MKPLGNWTRREALAHATAGVFAYGLASPASAQAVSTVAWDFITQRAVTIAVLVGRRADAIAAALNGGGGDPAFTSVFGSGGGSPAERKRRTLAAGRELGQIAFDERTQLLVVFDRYLATPNELNWRAVNAAMTGITARLEVVQKKLDALAGTATTTDAGAVVDEKARMLEEQAREGRPVTPAEIAAFRRFRNAFGKLVEQKARLAEQLARLGASM